MTVLPAGISLELEIENIPDRFRLLSFQSHFVLNQIPEAVCQVAVGRDAYTGKTAEIHKTADSIERLAKAKVWLTLDGQYDYKTQWPKKETMIFDGRVNGIGQVASYNQIAYTITLHHWLIDLHHSSTFSAISHPSNPADLTWSAVKGGPALNTGLNQVVTLLTAVPATSSLNFATVMSDDVWGKCLKQILSSIAEQKHVRTGSELNPCLATAQGKNDHALAALSRIDGVGPKSSRAYSCYAPPLKLAFGVTPEVVTGTLLNGIMQETVAGFISQTFWGKIVQNYASMLMCQVVPMVDHALFTAVTPGLRSTYCKSIEADDYDTARFMFPPTEPLRAVGIISTKGSRTNFGTPNTSKLIGIGGCFAPSDSLDLGTIRFFGAPAWLENVFTSDASPGKTTGMRAKVATSSIYTPQSDSSDAIKAGSIVVDETKRLDDVVAMYQAYAQTLFITNSLRGRVGTLSGKLRFDIAPGSNVLVEAKNEPFIGTSDQLVTELIGTVTKVTTYIDAEAAQVGTSFEFAYIRTKDENASDSFSMDRHPLFADSFVGGPLHDDLQFGSCCR